MFPDCQTLINQDINQAAKCFSAYYGKPLAESRTKNPVGVMQVFRINRHLEVQAVILESKEVNAEIINRGDNNGK
ncbi:MAG: hypothetical protein AB1706_17085 [Pseudomonadota bacterium]